MATESPGIDLGIEGITDAVRVGHGSFGAVYRAEQPRFRRTVAVKVIATPLVDEESRRVFERECQALGTLSGHPNIVTLYGAGITSDNHPYLVMDFLPGGSLGDRLERGRIGWQEAVSIGVKVAGALAAAHAAGVLHRDVKPENVLLSAYNEPQLADFGVAKLQSGTRTTMGMMSGSVAHAAPEVLSGMTASPESDVWSLASTVATLLAGEGPFHRDGDESLQPLLMRIMTAEPNDLGPLGVPDEVSEVIRGALAKDTWARTPTAVAFGQALEDAQRRLGVAVTPMALPSADGAVGAPESDEWVPDQPVVDQPVPDQPAPEVAAAGPVADPTSAPAIRVPPEMVAPVTDAASVRADTSGQDHDETRRRAPAPLGPTPVAPTPSAGARPVHDTGSLPTGPPGPWWRRLPGAAAHPGRTAIGAVAAVLVLVVGAVVVLSGGGGSRSARSAPTAAAVTTASTVASTVASTRPAPVAHVILQDDFTNPASGWVPDLNQVGTGSSSYQPDGLHVAVPKPFPNPLNAFSVAAPTSTRLMSLSATVTLTFLAGAPGDGAGLRCDQGDRAHLRYSFEVHRNGDWLIFKIDDQGTLAALAQGSNPTVITTGASDLMTATCTEAADGTTKLGLIVNGVSLGTASDAHPQKIAWHTGVIVYRSTTAQPTEVRFNSFRLVDTSTP